ncbi:hypothetical protein J6590_048871 [Homalodisca vitripennis]|nr:hypothetical protein J6590_048871 [Homalodisca vitripennis]
MARVQSIDYATRWDAKPSVTIEHMMINRRYAMGCKAKCNYRTYDDKTDATRWDAKRSVTIEHMMINRRYAMGCEAKCNYRTYDDKQTLRDGMRSEV